MIRTLDLKPWIDLSVEFKDKTFVSASLDHSGRLSVLLIIPDVIYRNDSGVVFETKTPHDFTVIEATNGYIQRLIVRNQYKLFYHLQPLPNGEKLLVHSRAWRDKNDDSHFLNASVFSEDGTFKREFLLGDGIRSIQTSRKGRIWTSYFDEGVLGNYGWDAKRFYFPKDVGLRMWEEGYSPPLGQSGLIKWDSYGKRLYEFRSPIEDLKMWDTYAMNVVSERETWLYYYNDFPLMRLVTGEIPEYWYAPIRGSKSFAIYKNYVLFYGCYDDCSLRLYKLGKKHKMTLIATYESNPPIDKTAYGFARGSKIVILRDEPDNIFYCVDLVELVESL